MFEENIKKLDHIRSQGINPYPYRYEVDATTKLIQSNHSDLIAEAHSEKIYSLAGRLMQIRSMGKAAFAHIQDEFGRIQVYLRKDDCPDFDLLKSLDLGDIVGIQGHPFKTKTGELSIYVNKITLLTKSLEILPEKYHGLKDVEIRYRKRYLDLIVNPEIKEVFRKRTLVVKTIREILDRKDFMEVETPILQPIYGGAAARPFKTFFHELKMDTYLRISNELYLKRLLVGGFTRVYEFARDFRNESIDTTHNPEFTNLEVYQAYADLYDIMDLCEEIYEKCCIVVNGKLDIEFDSKNISFKRPFARMTMAEAISKFASIDVMDMSESDLFKIIEDNNIKYEKEKNWGFMVAAIFEHFCEDKLIEPTFITEHPIETTPLCKLSRKDPRFVERFELFCCGMELCNAYSELNDPILQRKLLMDQQAMLVKGDNEANPLDEDFINAIEIGMPPAGGIGFGIDRMLMLLTNNVSIRDVLLFPFMKPEKK